MEEITGERRRKGRRRNTNRGLVAMDYRGTDYRGDGVGMSNGAQGGTTVWTTTNKQTNK